MEVYNSTSVQKHENVVKDSADVADKDIESDGLEGQGKIDLLTLDLQSLDSVRQCAADFLSKSKRLNLLICNAGVMATPEGRTKEGFETQFGVNHIAHFLLFQLLKDALLASSTPASNSRVVMLSSNGHTLSPLQLDNLSADKGGYNKWLAYAQSKLCNVYTALEIDRRYGSRGLHATAVHPGAISDTGLARDLNADDFAYLASRKGLTQVLKTRQQGAATTVWAAVAKEWEGTGGKYLEDVGVSVPQTEELQSFFRGYAPHTYDQQQAERLWEESLTLVGMKGEGSL